MTDSNRRWRLGYIAFSVFLSLALLARLWWSWPDAMWLSQFWNIEDIDRVQRDGLEPSSFWIGLGGEHAITGYRWFQYLSAALFGLSSQAELIVYALLALALSVAVGLRALGQVEKLGGRTASRMIVFVIPLVAFSMVGAGSRGMELGQYAGVTAFVLLALGIESRIPARWFSPLAYISALALTLLVLGGYSAPIALAFGIVLLVQWIRPVLKGEHWKKFRDLSLAFVGFAVFWLALMASSGATNDTASGGLGSLRAQTEADWLFPAKYLFSGFAAGVINAYTLEGIPLGSTLVYAVSAIVLALFIVGLILLLRGGWQYSTVPLILVAFGPALGLFLMAARNTSGALWLLSPWYGYLFRLPIIGVVWVTAIALAAHRRAPNATDETADGLRLGSVVLLSALLTILGIANLAQWERQPNERAYFQSVQNATLFPQELVVGPGGLTQLQLSLAETERGLAVLREHGLGLYRDPVGTVTSSSSFVRQGGLAISGVSPDGWAGPRVRAVVVDPTCTQVAVEVLPFQYLDRAFATSASRLRLTTSFSRTTVRRLEDKPVAFTLRPRGEFANFDLSFSKTWNLERLGRSPDGRDLSARISLQCGP